MTTSAPKKPPDAKACIKISPDGLTLYSNRSALKALAAWLEWIADSDPKEHFECHYRMTFEDEAAVLEGKRPSNITLVADESLQTSVILPGPDEFGFELTFMHASDEELEKMAKDR